MRTFKAYSHNVEKLPEDKCGHDCKVISLLLFSVLYLFYKFKATGTQIT